MIYGLSRIKRGVSKLKGFISPGPLVLLYHRVTHLYNDPHFLAVTPENFEAHLQVLRQYYHVISLSDMIKKISNGESLRNLITITFDDGYSDNAKMAFPLLQKYRLPAMFYLASGFVGSHYEQYHDELERLLFFPSKSIDKISINIGGSLYEWALNIEKTDKSLATSKLIWNVETKYNFSPLVRIYCEILAILKESTPIKREAVLEELRRQCGDSGQARTTHRGMSWDHARMMSKSHLIDFGVHTVNHPYLSNLSFNLQKSEIITSKSKIEEEIDKSLSSFAYPFGTCKSYTSETVALLKNMGFTNSCSNFTGRICRSTDLFQIPRFVVRDWSGDEFHRQILNAHL